MRFETLFNKSWYFIKLGVDAAKEEALAVPEENWEKINLPHDWLIYDSNNLYEDSTGWYRKWFGVYYNSEKSYYVGFDGVYMDCTMYVNGVKAGENHYGYSSFEIDMTPYIRDGENEILVRVCHRNPNSRWYSGAGIFRDVTYRELPKTHISYNGVYVSAKKVNDRWLVITDTEVEGPDADRVTYSHGLVLKEQNPENVGTISKPCSESEGFIVQDSSHGDNCSLCNHPCASRSTVRVSDVEYSGNSCSFIIDNPFVWDIENPNLYELKTSVLLDDKEIDSVVTVFGLRDIVYTTDRGLILNGRRVKINGVCEHHDLGCLGAAFDRDVMRRKFILLKQMGANAVRTSHNMPAKGLMELADEMGIMIDSEAFDMWHHSKTEYDYARFFETDCEKDIESWIKRDRNHPSVIMWSIGNEIYDCHADTDAPETTERLGKCVEKYDYLHNAPVTFASNYMQWDGAKKCADRLELVGYNYGEKLYDGHHAEHPEWKMYGSETCSTIQSRGVYHFPLHASIMADDDEQCSALGNCATSWGAPNTEYVIKAERDRDYSAGQFIWTGFDYIGEPTPYHTKNSYFGQLDTAGFPKDSYYIFKSAWTDCKKAPFVHVFPYWDFNEGQLIDVRIASNASEVELFCNGESLGRKKIDHEHGEEIVPSWTIPYKKGYIEAVAYDSDGNVLCRERRTSFGDAAEIRYDKKVYGRLAFFEIYAVDNDGNVVENARCRVNVRAEKGTLLGLDNGDSTDYEQYKCSSRLMFNGKLLAVVKADDDAEMTDVDITASADMSEDIHVRKIELSVDGDRCFKSSGEARTVTAKILPQNANTGKIVWQAVNDYGVKSDLCEIICNYSVDLNRKMSDNISLKSEIRARGDGNFRIRCLAFGDDGRAKCISSLEFSAEGIGEAFHNPYEFTAGSLYSDSSGNVGNGNEKGVATPYSAGSFIGYSNLDFGQNGSDTVTIPVFALTGEEYHIGIWDGRPGVQGSRQLCDALYCKPMIWNVYQAETYRLNAVLKGIHDIYFTASDKIHIKGFIFDEKNAAFEMNNASDCTRVYGDTFDKRADGIFDIGNNVNIEFDDMDFKDEAPCRITVCGHTENGINSINLKITNGEETTVSLLDFRKGDSEQTFEITGLKGKCRLAFVFLPGSSFDFRWFRIEGNDVK